MTIHIILVAGVVVLIACGVSLMLERSLTRMLLGFLLVGNGVNLMLFTLSGAFGLSPIYRSGTDPVAYSDPLPQAFILTAIVITFGVTAFLLALIYRAWKLAQADTVEDDSEDIALRDGVTSPADPLEEFTDEDSGDTEFGQNAVAAIAGHTIIDADDAGAGEDPAEERTGRDGEARP